MRDYEEVIESIELKSKSYYSRPRSYSYYYSGTYHNNSGDGEANWIVIGIILAIVLIILIAWFVYRAR